MTAQLPRIADLVAQRRPTEPLICLRPQVFIDTAIRYRAAIPGTAMYAVKCNPHPVVLENLYRGGIRQFDVASAPEWRPIRSAYPDAVCHYMHPIKPIESIAEAYHQAGIRTYALDHPDELEKLHSVFGGDPSVLLMIRLATDQSDAAWALGGKFGAEMDQAGILLQAAANHGYRTGLAFHVGSQCRSPGAFAIAIDRVAKVADTIHHELAAVDIGGGFPAPYPADPAPALEDFGAAIQAAWTKAGLGPDLALYSEPGRALVAEGMSILLRVELRRGQALYLNDGTYGTLAELPSGKWTLPMRAHRLGGNASASLADFQLFGPTCDSMDQLPGPYRLPSDIRIGDWVEIGCLGAYSLALRTRFNGFHASDVVDVCDPPLGVASENAPIDQAAPS